MTNAMLYIKEAILRILNPVYCREICFIYKFSLF